MQSVLIMLELSLKRKAIDSIKSSSKRNFRIKYVRGIRGSIVIRGNSVFFHTRFYKQLVIKKSVEFTGYYGLWIIMKVLGPGFNTLLEMRISASIHFLVWFASGLTVGGSKFVVCFVQI